jgi:hypothetical protein
MAYILSVLHSYKLFMLKSQKKDIVQKNGSREAAFQLRVEIEQEIAMLEERQSSPIPMLLLGTNGSSLLAYPIN